jgi:hypothetical protein
MQGLLQQSLPGMETTDSDYPDVPSIPECLAVKIERMVPLTTYEQAVVSAYIRWACKRFLKMRKDGR